MSQTSSRFDTGLKTDLPPLRHFTLGSEILPRVLLAADATFILIAAIIYWAGISPSHLGPGDYWTQVHVPLLLVGLCSLFAANGHYTNRCSFSAETEQIVIGVALVALLASLKYETAAGFWVTILLTLVAGRVAFKWLLFKLRWTRLPVLIVGPEARCCAVASAMERDWYRGFEIRKRIDTDEITSSVSAANLLSVSAHGGIQYVLIVADKLTPDLVKLQALAGDSGITVSLILSSISCHGRLVIDRFFGDDSVSLREVPSRWSWRDHRAKRGLDLVLSALMLILVSPVLLPIALMVRRDGGAVLYGSARLGRGGKIFHALKFRTMVPNADQVLQTLLAADEGERQEWKTTFKLRNDPRITPVGRFLRQYSLDEVPQLINVLRGEMSLVGPRPMLPAEREVYGKAFDLYSQCTPGLTGPWQGSGRNDIDYQRRIELNSWYAKHSSLWVDIIILLRTPLVVFRHVGAV
jgi:Undecaprenyl-phosphate galactose phosphotransferase WbaP